VIEMLTTLSADNARENLVNPIGDVLNELDIWKYLDGRISDVTFEPLILNTYFLFGDAGVKAVQLVGVEKLPGDGQGPDVNHSLCARLRENRK
jgi:hypothetical protein